MSDIISPPKPIDLLGYTKPRTSRPQTRKLIRQSRAQLHAVLRHVQAYTGGLPAERQSATRLTDLQVELSRKQARQAWCNRKGRKIDLPLLMGQRDKEGRPVWAIVDPVKEIGEYNGKYDTDGSFSVGGRWQCFPNCKKPAAPVRSFVPNGIPALPQRARRILSDHKIRRRAKWIGVLYQPESWTEVRPDPAVVCEWSDLPGQYYALMVWGPDYHRIMEFVS